MTSVWRLICPNHQIQLDCNKTIPINKDGIVTRYPIFFCEKCGKYYIHTDVVPFDIDLDYGQYKVYNIKDKPFIKNDYIEIKDWKHIRPYDEPFIPTHCYKDGTKLKYIKHAYLKISNKIENIEGYWCKKCNDFYIKEETYDELSLIYQLDTINITTKNKYSYAHIRPNSIRKSNEYVSKYLENFELLEKNYQNDFPFSLVHYAFLYRRFDFINNIITKLTKDEWNNALHFKGPIKYEWITPLVCAKWNLNYIYSYDEKNGTQIIKSIQHLLHEVDYIDEIIEYTDVVDKSGKNIFDIVWGKNQPLLDVIYYEKQELASKQVNRKNISIIIDEVGTGKTVSALYAIRNVIKENKKNNKLSKILVICPYNKREDWQDDIRRQLGRYAHIVEQNDNGLMYSGALKKVFFKNSEEVIMISGQKKGLYGEGSYSALKDSIEQYSEHEKWDLVIIDECHISFDNYNNIISKKAMLLTATPIVINVQQTRNFYDYLNLLKKITGTDISGININPITKCIPDESDVYVNWFREDFGKKAVKRKIKFISCKRCSDRNDLFYKIKDKAGLLAALQYEQDDEYLFHQAINKYGFNIIKKFNKNAKLEKLVEFLKSNSKSYIIFCEHQFVVDLIFNKLKNEFSQDIIAEKFGKFENQYNLENIQNGQLINTLVQSLRVNKRVIFITTGKTGGTGLNLGQFDGIIHYELPFTSIELEQRFGRIDRIDTNSNSKNKEMIFMLNECNPDENDLEINRMLYYCSTKIDITCKYMPIRNTILYYPEFIKRNGIAIRDSLIYFQNEYVLSEVNEKIIREIRQTRRKYENKIKNSEFWFYMETLGSTVYECVIKTLKNEKNNKIPDTFYNYISEYIEFLNKTKAQRNEYERVYKQFLQTKRNINNWLSIIGLIKIENQSEIFVGYKTTKNGTEIEYEQQTDDLFEYKKISPVQNQIKQLIDLIDKSEFKDIELNAFSSEGIFCYIDNSIHRLNVNDYRKGSNWN